MLLSSRVYQYKDTLMEPWRRKNNWNRWATSELGGKNGPEGRFAHYNQTLGLGFYDYFLLCEMIGAKLLQVLNVGMACQWQSTAKVILLLCYKICLMMRANKIQIKE